MQRHPLDAAGRAKSWQSNVRETVSINLFMVVIRLRIISNPLPLRASALSANRSEAVNDSQDFYVRPSFLCCTYVANCKLEESPSTADGAPPLLWRESTERSRTALFSPYFKSVYLRPPQSCVRRHSFAGGSREKSHAKPRRPRRRGIQKRSFGVELDATARRSNRPDPSINECQVIPSRLRAFA